MRKLVALFFLLLCTPVLAQSIQVNGISPSALKVSASQATTSGTSVTFSGLPPGVKQIFVNLSGVSTNGNSTALVRIGPSGGVETSGYDCYVGNIAGTSAATAANTGGLQLPTLAATATRSGLITFTLMEASTNTWAAQGVVADNTANSANYISCVKALAGSIERVSLTTSGGTDTFDAGKASISWE